jgi:hypothetical protein
MLSISETTSPSLRRNNAYRLDGCHAHSRLRGGRRIKIADALDVRVATILVDQRAFADAKRTYAR